jgi:glycerophosphoryl diester phosphodiesterase
LGKKGELMVKVLVCFLALFAMQACDNSSAMIEKKIYPVLVAHRGGMITYPENSLISFENAIRYTQYIEMDTQFSRDNVAVVIHDKGLSRTTNCTGLVREKYWIELKKCKLKEKLDWNDSPYYISRFEEVMKSNILKDAILIVEIKEYNTLGIDRLIGLIKDKKNILIESFNINILEYIHSNYGYENLYLISNKMPKTIPNFLKGLILNYKNITPGVKKDAGNINIFVWTVDKKEDFEKYYKYNIDGIMTNDVRYFSTQYEIKNKQNKE